MAIPPSGSGTGTPAPLPLSARIRRFFIRLIVFLIIVPPILLALYIWAALSFSYSSGERAGYVQKFSDKGWVCKTWEGELAMVNLPGTTPQIFPFTVREDKVAAEINKQLGERVVLSYEQHMGLPACFGETEYFVTGVRRVKP